MEINNTFTSLLAHLPYPSKNMQSMQSKETTTSENLEKSGEKSFEEVQKSLENKNNDDSKKSVNILA